MLKTATRSIEHLYRVILSAALITSTQTHSNITKPILSVVDIVHSNGSQLNVAFDDAVAAGLFQSLMMSHAVHIFM